jgi:hypothetical protein
MCHVDVKLSVAGDLETHDFAIVRQTRVGPEAVDSAFQGLNIRRPPVTEKLVFCRDRRVTAATESMMYVRGGLAAAGFDARILAHSFTPPALPTCREPLRRGATGCLSLLSHCRSARRQLRSAIRASDEQHSGFGYGANTRGTRHSTGQTWVSAVLYGTGSKRAGFDY